MLTFIVRRVLISIPLLWAVLTITFFGFRLVPGDPVEVILGISGSKADRIRLHHELGLDRPLLVQYWNFLKGAVHFDFGDSIISHQSVTHEIAVRFPTTLELAASGLVLAMGFGLLGGVLAAVFNRTFLGTGITGLAVLGISIPEFVLGTVLGLVVGVKLGWLPVAGTGGWKYEVLPACSLGLAIAAGLTRLTRATMLEVMGQDYVRTARAKGVARSVILLKHVLRNALLPVVTLFGLSIASLLGGAVIIENVFALPGLGTLAISAVNGRDFPVIEGTTFFFSVILVAGNLLVDISYAFIDPRIHFS